MKCYEVRFSESRGEQDDFLHIKQETRSCKIYVGSSSKNREWLHEYILVKQIKKLWNNIQKSSKIQDTFLPKYVQDISILFKSDL